ncbi:putative phosphoinositide phospholipase C [Lyophyllum shimeji]|uniref:Phosphoinositide phospholipase C n=1 Tax=Lyophyllum shimeji TaxID=47721 RepID=A0A9P3UNN4_LYOSH|nr:putative phosphoinositide phospholipase C [Lyophyllum shimeji]
MLKVKLHPTPLPSPIPSPVPLLNSEHNDFSVPNELLSGSMMLKISEKKKKRALFQLDPDQGRLIYKRSKTRIVPLETIKEVRSGHGARYYREQFAYPESAEERWLTVMYILEGTYKTLHILADTRDVFEMWDSAVRKLVAIRQGLMTGLGNIELREAVWERQYWKGADVECDNKLSFEEVQGLCRRLNANLSRPALQILFDNADTKSKGYLEFAEFQAFVKELRRRPEIESIYWDLYKANGDQFEFPAFERFMRDTQHTDLSQDELKTIFAKYSWTSSAPSSSSTRSVATIPTPSTQYSAANATSANSAPQTDSITGSPQTAPSSTLTLDGFSAFLLSPDNAVFSAKDRNTWQDMTRPISEYYISSSHNTYLIGHQLVGVSTIEGYIRALLHSCRSVELDIYDGDTEPVVFHGKTFTSKVPLRDICNAIAKYAFVASPYPLLISAEVHCGLKQQDKLVEIMLEAFGEDLVRAPVEGRPKISVLPSPEDLKGKFLLKAKNLYVVAQLEALRAKPATPAPAAEKPRVLEAEESSSESESSEDDEAGTKLTGEIKNGLSELKHKWRHMRGKDASSTSASTGSAKPKVKMSFALASLLVYTVGVKCRGLGQEHGYAPEHIFSLSEHAANKVIKVGNTMRELVRHTRGHMVRIYPKGTRVNSTNYQPHRYWAAGAQLVAINWQTFDLGYMMNQAMFQRNGRAGFVLKPDVLRGDDDELLSKRTKHILEVTVISAHQLPRLRDSNGQEIVDNSVVDPLVQISLHIPDWTHSPLLSGNTSTTTLPVSESVTFVSERTRTVKNNGFNPVWQETLRLPFEVVGGPGMRELVFVRFSVLEDDHDGHDDEPIAQYCTPLACLEQGYRHLPLHDSQLSQYLFSTLQDLSVHTWTIIAHQYHSDCKLTYFWLRVLKIISVQLM